jgi:hypothetical protein
VPWNGQKLLAMTGSANAGFVSALVFNWRPIPLIDLGDVNVGVPNLTCAGLARNLLQPVLLSLTIAPA